MRPLLATFALAVLLAILLAFAAGLATGQATASRPAADVAIPTFTPIASPSPVDRQGLFPALGGESEPRRPLTGAPRGQATPAPSPEPSPPRRQETAAAPTAKPSGQRIAGVATWYCGAGSPCTRGYGPGDLVAAAGSELQTGKWRGRLVTVTAGGRSVRVRLVDSCWCKGDRIIDLTRSAFARLADPSRGLVRVTVSW
jgi:rare lipoprotein A (peptidoglycan hydrolase)